MGHNKRGYAKLGATEFENQLLAFLTHTHKFLGALAVCRSSWGRHKTS